MLYFLQMLRQWSSQEVMTSVNIYLYPIVAKLACLDLQTNVKCIHTWLSLTHNKSNNHCSHHYNGNYNDAQESTDEDNWNTRNCMDTSEKGEVKSVLAWKLLHQYYTLTNRMTSYVITKGMSKFTLLYKFSIESNIVIIVIHHRLFHLYE